MQAGGPRAALGLWPRGLDKTATLVRNSLACSGFLELATQATLKCLEDTWDLATSTPLRSIHSILVAANRAAYHSSANSMAATANCDLWRRDALLRLCTDLPKSVKAQLRQTPSVVCFSSETRGRQSRRHPKIFGLVPLAPPPAFQRPARRWVAPCGPTDPTPVPPAFPVAERDRSRRRARAPSPPPNPPGPGAPAGLGAAGPTDSPLPRPPPIFLRSSVGGRLIHRSEVWRLLFSDEPWILQTISEGLQISF